MMFSLQTVLATICVAFVTFASAVPITPRSDLARRWPGTATYFFQHGHPGSCGQVHQDSDFIVALPFEINPKQQCGRSIKVQRGDKRITALCADTCPGCSDGTHHIDLSHGAFTALGAIEEGVIPINWWFDD